MMKTEEITELDQMLDAELKCNSRHSAENKHCSGTVTHKVFDCNTKPIVCANTYVWALTWMSGMLCGGCSRPASECWRIIPI